MHRKIRSLRTIKFKKRFDKLTCNSLEFKGMIVCNHILSFFTSLPMAGMQIQITEVLSNSWVVKNICCCLENSICPLREQIPRVKHNIKVSKIKISKIVWTSYRIIRQSKWSKYLEKDLDCTKLVEQVWYAIKYIPRESLRTQCRRAQRT